MVSVHAAKSSKEKLAKFSPTRWLRRHESVMVMAELLDSAHYTQQEPGTW